LPAALSNYVWREHWATSHDHATAGDSQEEWTKKEYNMMAFHILSIKDAPNFTHDDVTTGVSTGKD
jgi:hypothetical protein